MMMQPLDLYRSIPRQSAPLSIHHIDDHALVRLPGTQQVICLNRSACAVLDQIDGLRTIREIADRLATSLGLGATHLLEDVTDAVLSMASSGLVAVAAPPAEEQHAASRNTNGLAIRFAEQTINLCSPSSAVRDELRNRFALMLSPPAPAPDAKLRVEAHRDAWVYFATGAGDVKVTRTMDGAHVRDHLKSQVVQCCMRMRPDFLWLHAGAAVVDGRCVLVAGTNGRGKSSLIAELCRAGALYLSDEIVPVDAVQRSAAPFPVTPIQRESTAAPLPRHRLREIKRHYVRLEPRQVCASPRPVAAMVFPEFSTSSAPQLERCTAAHAALSLVESGLLSSSTNKDVVEQSLDLCRDVPATRLVFRDARLGAAQIRKWLDRAANPGEIVPMNGRLESADRHLLVTVPMRGQ